MKRTLARDLGGLIGKEAVLHAELTPEEQASYEEPFLTFQDRKPILAWPRQIPIDGEPAEVHEVVASYSAWLARTEIPKLLLTATPGASIQHERVTV